MGAPVEAEVKIRCGDVDALVRAHPDLGWAVLEPRHFEDNFVFELPDHALERRGSILRLRVARGRATLTYKGMLPESDASAIKVREELETEVADPGAVAAIFERLGLRRAFRYQKWRTTYRLTTPGGEVKLMRDETPMGNFLELEGEEPAVEAAARRLGFSRSDYITGSYIGMQAARCRAAGVPLEDLVFKGDRDQGSGVS
jgi:adenylate cyclase class 2